MCGGLGVSGGEGGPMNASFSLSDSEVGGVGKAAWGCDYSGSDMAVLLVGSIAGDSTGEMDSSTSLSRQGWTRI